MDECSVTFLPHNRTIHTRKGDSLLKTASLAHITLNSLCGGEGICGRCRMIVRQGEVSGEVSGKLTREEIKAGYVLACMTFVQSDVVVEIPEETLAKEKVISDEDAERFRDLAGPPRPEEGRRLPSPLVRKIHGTLAEPSLIDQVADHQRVCEAIQKRLDVGPLQMGLKIMRSLPQILRDHHFEITATVGLRRDIAEVMNVEGGNTEAENWMVIVDIGTTTIVAHLVNGATTQTVDAKACFNSQGIYGREVTGRIISAEKHGVEELQRLVVQDINRLVLSLVEDNHIKLTDVTAVICAGNTAMEHFLLGLPTRNIRRFPYIPTSVEPAPLRAVEVGIQIDPRGLLYSLPCISGWVGSDLSCGILATRMHKSDELCLLVDIGTNGEIIVGNKEWLVACSASAGPAIEGASEEFGMRAEAGAIEKVFLTDGEVGYSTIGDASPLGICGSGVIDLLSVLFLSRIIDRSGKFISPPQPQFADRVGMRNGVPAFTLVNAAGNSGGRDVVFTESDIEQVITAKAAIFAAMNILLRRLDLSFGDVDHFFIAGAFGNYLSIESAISLGLIPDIPREKIEFVGNTSIRGAKLAALYEEEFLELRDIREKTTYYDLMGADDYIDEFQQAMFLPHTHVEYFPSLELAERR